MVMRRSELSNRAFNFFESAGHAGGVLLMPGLLDTDSRDGIRCSWKPVVLKVKASLHRRKETKSKTSPVVV